MNSNSVKVPGLNVDTLDGLDSTAFLCTTGGILTGSLMVQNPATISLGGTARQMLTLFDNGFDNYGTGVQSATQYFRSGEHFAWFKDGVHSNTTFDAGTGGTTLMTLSNNGTLAVSGTDAGYYTRNREDSTKVWAVYGVSDTGFAGRFQGKLDVTGAASLGSTLNVTGSSTFSNEVNSVDTLGGFAVKNRNDQSKRWMVNSRNSGPTDQLAFYSSSSNGEVAALSPNGDMYLVGALSTTVLTIRGGAL